MSQRTSSKITGSAPKLGGQGCVSYEITSGGDGLEFKIVGNTEGGTFTDGLNLKLKTVLCCAAHDNGAFTTESLKTAIGSANYNDAGFFVAVLKHVGVIAGSDVPDGHHSLVGFSPN